MAWLEGHFELTVESEGCKTCEVLELKSDVLKWVQENQQKVKTTYECNNDNFKGEGNCCSVSIS